jgi:Fe-S cluster assembly iron-binding protein IscA
MLAISPQASEAIRGIAAATEETENTILRIASAPDGLQIELANGPEDGDVIVEDEGAELAIEPTAAVLLDDKLLDASFVDGEGVTFIVSDQASSNGVPPGHEPEA